MEVRRDPVTGWHRQLDSEPPRLTWVTAHNGHPRALREDTGRQSPVPRVRRRRGRGLGVKWRSDHDHEARRERSEEHTSELQSLAYLVCRLLLEKKNKQNN